MSDLTRLIPRERLDALNGWKPLAPPVALDGLVPEEDLLHLATARDGADGLIFAQPIPDTEPNGSFGGRSLPRGVAASEVGDVYVCDPEAGKILYTRASLPPEAEHDSAMAPFVPLWHFPTDPGPTPLNLQRPVDIALVPAETPPGTFADALVIADAARNMVIWVDRRQIVTRHVLTLDQQPVSVAVASNGDVGILTHDAFLRVRRGQLVATVATDAAAHTVVALTAGRFVLIGATGAQQVAQDNTPSQLVAPFMVLTPAFEVISETLHLSGACDNQDALPFDLINIDRLGRLEGTDLTLVTRPSRLTRPRSGAWFSQAFDGEMRAFAWDRVALEAVIPNQCRLLLSSFVSDDFILPEELKTEAVWSDPMVFDPGRPTEALIQANRGRYLWLKIEAFGDGSKSPAISGIDVFGPRNSQLSLLPTPFHQDPISANFLDRFLSLQDAFLSEALWMFRSVGAILRPEATPEEFLAWLGSWFDWRFLAKTDLQTRREMIARSFEMFGKRGTIEGLEQLLRWQIGLEDAPLPLVLEDYNLAAEATPYLSGRAVSDAGAHRFTVVVPQSRVKSAQDEAALHRLIEAQKPAHTIYRLSIVEPGLVPGEQARLGVDAILPDSRPPPLSEGRLDIELQTVATR